MTTRVGSSSANREVLPSRLRLPFASGWYLDELNAHSVANPGPGQRIHLVVDCIVNPALLRMLAASLSCGDVG